MSDAVRQQLQSSLGAAYVVERELGGGGMARVFVARDQSLGRDVVVKVLAPELTEALSVERFAREIRLAAGLQAPHIVPVISAGTTAAGLPYYLMPYVAGETLRARIARGPVGVAEAVSILRDVATALEHAHGQHVVHRDVKPENILLSGRTAVVADFGIAKALEASKHEKGGTLTQAGSSIGTPAYMAPEQALGDAVDARADLYSWGVVAYELLAGRPPFDASSAQKLIIAHVMEEPAPLLRVAPHVPVALAALVGRCLAKDPADRPSSAAVLIAALDATLVPAAAGDASYRPASAPAPVASPAVAVLPFANLSSDPENEFLSDGITDEIIYTLGRIDGLRVAGRTSCFALKGQTLDPAAVGRRLDVTSVVDGSVRRAGNRVRVQAELVSTADGFQLWSERYDRELSDVFALQEEIARAIASALRVRLGRSTEVRVAAPPTADAGAYELYLRGRHASGRRTTTASFDAVKLLEESVGRDAAFARAWAALADAYLAAPLYTGAAPAVAWPRAREAIERALALDPSLAEAHTSLAYGMMLYEWDWTAAEAGFQRAIAANASYATAHHWYADFLAGRGRLDDALREMTLAHELEPLSPIISVELAWVLGMLRRGDEALAHVDKLLRAEPGFAHGYLVRGLVLQGRGEHAEAIASHEQAIAMGGFHAFAGAALVCAHAAIGERAESERLLAELEARAAREHVPPFAFALAHTGLGDHAAAFEWLERGVSERDELLAENFFDPSFDPLRGDARYAGVLARLGAGVVPG